MHRRKFGQLTLSAGIGLSIGSTARGDWSNDESVTGKLNQIADPLIRQAVAMAIEKTLEPAAAEKAYPGHFSVTADGKAFGGDKTWPGLDSWQLAGAYLLLGRTRMVLDYFDFVQAAQRADGNIPFAIFPAETATRGMKTYSRGLNYPDDVYAYKPMQRPGQPEHSDRSQRKWIGLFHHWQKKVNPLSVLGAISYVLTAEEISKHLDDQEWLSEKIDSVDRAGKYVLSRRSENGLISGAGFYTEAPPRNQWDGVTQCYAVKIFRELAAMHGQLNRQQEQAFWNQEADALADRFRQVFWQRDHFAEYVHPEHGVVDFHGLTDVNWAAIGLDVATDQQTTTVWPLLCNTPALWHGDMPTQAVAKPYAYRDWELCEPLPFHNKSGLLKDASAMGRVWYLETLACRRVGDDERLKQSVIHVCNMGKQQGWQWSERYYPIPKEEVAPVGPRGYCEYPAILVRTVLGSPDLF